MTVTFKEYLGSFIFLPTAILRGPEEETPWWELEFSFLIWGILFKYGDYRTDRLKAEEPTTRPTGEAGQGGILDGAEPVAGRTT